MARLFNPSLIGTLPLPKFQYHHHMGIKFNLRGSGPAVDDIQSESTRQLSASDDRRRKSVNDQVVTGAGEITTRQSIIPAALVTILFSMWRFAYRLPDVLNKHFQEVLHVSAAESAGL